MKRLFSTFFVLLLMSSLIITPAMATDDVTGYTIYYADGSYAIVVLNNNPTRSNINERKSYAYYNPQGQRCFIYVLYASFTYNGITSRADSCDYAVTIYRQGWDVDTHSEYISGNTAYGNATFTGPDSQVRTANLTLTCDKSGNVP